MGKKLLTLLAVLLLHGAGTIHAQYIWHSNLGDVEMGVVNIPYDRTTYSIQCYTEDTPGILSGVEESLNSQLSAADIDWVTVESIDLGDNSETFEINIALDTNYASVARQVLFGTQNRFFSLTQQVQGWSGDPGYSGNGPQVLINDPDTTVWVPPLAQADIRIVMGTYQQTYTLYRFSDWTGGTATTVNTFTCTGDDMHYRRTLSPGRYRFSFQDPDDYFYVRIPEFLEWEYEFDNEEYVVDSTAHTLTIFSETVMTPQGQYFVSEFTDYKLPHLDDVMYALFHGRAPYWESGWRLQGGMDEDGALTLYINIPANTGSSPIVSSFPDSTGTGWHFRIIQAGSNTAQEIPRNPDVVEDDAPVYRTDRDTHFLSCSNSIVTHAWNGGNAPEATDVTYFDGLGYPSLELSPGAGGNVGGIGALARKDILRPYAYDHLLREDRTYLPYARAATNAPALPSAAAWKALADTTAFASQDAWYRTAYPQQMADTSFAWTDIRLESAEGGRPLSSMKPGPEYRHALKKARTRYRGNDSLEVFRLAVNPSSGAMTVDGYYDRNTLQVVRETDEDGGELRTYTDREGRKVLERRLLAGDPADTTSTCTWADTYYAYDWAGRPAWVVTPNGSVLLAGGSGPYEQDGTFAGQYCYCYAYDARGNVIMSRAPGTEAVQFGYDAANRLIRRQDAVMAQNDLYVSYIYDANNRPLQETLLSDMDEEYSVLLRKYVYDSYPASMHDSLAFKNAPGVTSGLSARADSTAGFLTYEKINVLGTDDYVERAYHYDSRGNAVQVVERDPDGRILRTSQATDLAGNITSTLAVSYIFSVGTSWIRTVYTYDSRGRKVSCNRTVNGEAMSPVTYTYDALGRLVGKEASYASLTEQLDYDCRSWRTASTVKVGTADVFSQALRYMGPQKDAAAARYGGDISENAVMQYGTSPDTKTHVYSYDMAGRLSDADCYPGTAASPVNQSTEKDIAYDLAGAITSIKRYSAAGVLEDMHFTHNGPLLSEAVDSSMANPVIWQYGYDDNGARVSDTRKGFVFTNNILGLPASIVQNTRRMDLTYLADGTRTAISDGLGNGYRYVGPFVYSITRERVGLNYRTVERLHSVAWDEGRVSNVLESGSSGIGVLGDLGFTETEGLIDPPGGQDTWYLRDEWHVRDHLGNTRAVIDIRPLTGVTVADRILEQDDYTPFGTRLADFSLLPTDSYNRWRFGGKEEMTAMLFESDLLDFGARMYDPFTVRWISQDPMKEKYYGINPYSYCAGDPVNFVDPDGMKFRITRVGSTILIKANYTAYGDEAYKSAQKAVSFWNNRTDTYSENGKTYRIKYQLTVSLFGSASSLGAENTYKVVNVNELSEQQSGQTTKKKDIMVRCDYAEKTPEGKESTTGAHEIGHTLGMSHDDTTEGIMSKSQDEKRNNSVAKENIEQMMKSKEGIPKKPNLFERLFNIL